MSDGQAWAAEQFSTSKSKERGMSELVLKSTVSEHHLRVTDNGKSDSVFQVWTEAPNHRNGSFRGVIISDADADRLEAWLRERKKQQPRRPDEVGVWECWFEHQPHDKWQATVTSNTRGTWFSSKFGDHHIDDLCESVVGVRIGDLPSEEPQEAKPELIGAVNALSSAVWHLQDELHDICERSNLSTANANLAKAALERADKVLDTIQHA